MARSTPAAKRVAQKAKTRQAREQGDDRNQPVLLAGEWGRGSRVERGTHHTTLVLPRKEKPYTFDLSFLDMTPALANMFAEGVRRYAESGPTYRTLSEVIRNIKRPFVTYLKTRVNSHLTPLDLCDDALWTGFINYVNQPSPSGEPLHPDTRDLALGAIRRVLHALDSSSEWGHTAARIREHLPKNAWPAKSTKKTPTPVLDLNTYDSIVIAADKEFSHLRERWAEREQLLAAGRERLAAGARNFRQDFSLCLATLEAMYPGVIPNQRRLIADNSALGNAVQSKHGVQNLEKYLYASSRDLVPLVLLIAARTNFNPEVALSLTWSDFHDWETPDGRRLIQVAPFKPKAGNRQIRGMDPEPNSSEGLNSLLQLAESMTVRLRPYLAGKHQDRLWVFVRRSNKKSPTAFDSGADRETGDPWQRGLRAFADDHGIERFTLRNFRPTRGSEVLFTTGSLAAARDELGHTNAQTSWRHYTSDAVRRRQMERIGQVVLLGARWRETDAVIDPRGNDDPGAATPGFLCLNPNDSPRPGQVRGRPCTAYGECADCPMAAGLNDPSAAAQYLAVRDAIISGYQNMAAETWQQKWAPILAAHDNLLNAIDTDVLQRADSVKFTYPSVG